MRRTRFAHGRGLVIVAMGIFGAFATCTPTRDGPTTFAADDAPDEMTGHDDATIADADASADDASTTSEASDDAGDAQAPLPLPGLDATGPIAFPDGSLPHYPALSFSDIGQPVTISGQFLFTEGPVWEPAKEVLYFTDINANTIYQLVLPSTITPYITPSKYADGLALDPKGGLVLAGFRSRSVEIVAGDELRPVATSYQSMALNSPDDVVVRSDGIIYFTDPTFGIDGTQGFDAQSQQLSFEGVYRLTRDGTLHLEDQSMTGPNGIEFSPDEKTLYVSYTTPGTVVSFSVAADGALSNPTTFASGVTVADSMCVDAAGDLYVASLSGVAVFTPSGTRLGTIATGQIPTNCAFGGPDQRTLFITARKALTGTPDAGNSSLMRIDRMPIPGLPGRP